MFPPTLHTVSCYFDIFEYICWVMGNKIELPVVRYAWVAYEFSTGRFFVRRKKLDMVKFLESNTNTFDYRWRNSEGTVFWENKYIISRAELL